MAGWALKNHRSHNGLEETMKKLASAIAMAGLIVLSGGGVAQAQEKTFGRIVRGQPAPLQKSMTQAQARRICSQQMRGARESRSAIRQKMAICMRRQTEGI
ncbi:hypothetical protein [Bosea sp. (in: a-proteobacteria)]|uniref:hypothetical protein n=1 Tax=Bosea sp. (in: a-proteobacteria) TaxID=1871050 RepID=UPI003F72C899